MRKIFSGGIVVALGIATIFATQSGASTPTGPSLSFFSGGGGAFADWLATTDQPPGDTDNQAIRIVTTTAPTGFAGITVQHVYGIPTASFPNSSFDVKSTNFTGSSQGSPRLVVRFSDGGDGELRPLTLAPTYQPVADPNWDINGGTCGFEFEKTWQDVQACHAGTFITAVYLTTDPLGIEYRIDDLNVDGVNFTQGANNGTR